MRQVFKTGLIYLIAGILFVYGCGGSSGTTPTTNDSLDVALIQYAKDERLKPGPGPTVSTVKGVVKVEGFTVTVADDPPVIQPNMSGTIMVRIVNPEDDILSAKNVAADGSFSLITDSTLKYVDLVVDMVVEEDLDGDEEGKDQLVHRVPIELVHGKEIDLQLTLRKGEETEFDTRLLPSAGETMIANYSSLDGSGSIHEYYATVFNTGLVVFDLDGDKYFELGDDLPFPDGYMNGTTGEGLVRPGPAVMEPLYLIGTVLDVDIAERTVKIQLFDKTEVMVNIQQFNSIEIYNRKQDTFYGPIPLSSQLIENTVYIEYTLKGIDHYANWVVIYK